MKNWEIRTSEEKFHFITLGTEYYITGRIAYYRYFRISPMLLHYGIEYFFKAVLLDYHSLDELKKKGHDLISLLNLYQRIFPNGKVLENKKFIGLFHKIYKTRYFLKDGSHKISQTYSPTKDKRSKMINGRTMKQIKPDLEWSLEEIDEIIFNLCRNIKLEPTSIYEYIKAVAESSPDFMKDNKFFKEKQ